MVGAPPRGDRFYERAVRMPTHSEPVRIPDERLSIEQRTDGTLVVRVQSEASRTDRLPDARFSFRCGDPQYAYWLGRLESRSPNADHGS